MKESFPEQCIVVRGIRNIAVRPCSLVFSYKEAALDCIFLKYSCIYHILCNRIRKLAFLQNRSIHTHPACKPHCLIYWRLFTDKALQPVIVFIITL